MERAILLATDLRSDLGPGLSLATRFALERTATLVVLHVVPLAAEDGEAMIVTAADHPAAAAVRALAGQVPEGLPVPCRRRVEVGDPLAVIPQVVEEEGAELVLVETRPRGWLRRLVEPSLAVALSATLPCAVVTYRRGQSVPRSAETLDLPVQVSDVAHAAALLDRVLDARVHALVDLLDHARAYARDLASRASLRDAAAALLRGHHRARPDPFAERTRALLDLELREHQHALGALGVALLTDSGPLVFHGLRTEDDAGQRAFLDRVLADGARVSLPLEPADPSGPLVLEVGARVDLPGLSPAVLLFVLDANRDFLRILAQPGPTPSTETYAFDGHGVMLSNSRFPSQLRRMGLLPREPGAQTARRLRLCEPGGAPDAPLTRMAADAILGHDGEDVSGYPDYRGVPVIGRWRWIEAYEFGVAAEMDHPEHTA